MLTAFYMFRMWFLTFAGEPRGFPSAAEAVHSHVHDEEHALDKDHGTGHGHGHGHDRNPAAHAHESEPIMTWPLIILAVCSIFAGWTLWYVIPLPVRRRRLLEQMLEYGEPYRAIDTQSMHHYYALAASLVIMLIGHRAGLALLCSARASRTSCRPASARPGRPSGSAASIEFLVHKWYFDELYGAVLVRPCLALARLCREIDQVLIDGLVNGSAAADRSC